MQFGFSLADILSHMVLSWFILCQVLDESGPIQSDPAVVALKIRAATMQSSHHPIDVSSQITINYVCMCGNITVMQKFAVKN